MRDDTGPPDGGGPSRPMWDALNAELRRAVEDGGSRTAELLQVVAGKLAAKAADGDISAIKEIFDRIDGKTVAGSAPEQAQKQVDMQWKA
jgi:hypothetical protein